MACVSIRFNATVNALTSSPLQVASDATCLILDDRTTELSLKNVVLSTVYASKVLDAYLKSNKVLVYGSGYKVIDAQSNAIASTHATVRAGEHGVGLNANTVAAYADAEQGFVKFREMHGGLSSADIHVESNEYHEKPQHRLRCTLLDTFTGGNSVAYVRTVELYRRSCTVQYAQHDTLMCCIILSDHRFKYNYSRQNWSTFTPEVFLHISTDSVLCTSTSPSSSRSSVPNVEYLYALRWEASPLRVNVAPNGDTCATTTVRHTLCNYRRSVHRCGSLPTVVNILHSICALTTSSESKHLCVLSKSAPVTKRIFPSPISSIHKHISDLTLSTLPRVFCVENKNTTYAVCTGDSARIHPSGISNTTARLRHVSAVGHLAFTPNLCSTHSSPANMRRNNQCKNNQTEVHGAGEIGKLVYITALLNGQRLIRLTNRSGRCSYSVVVWNGSSSHSVTVDSVDNCHYSDNTWHNSRVQVNRSFFASGVLRDAIATKQTAYTIRVVVSPKLIGSLASIRDPTSLSVQTDYYSSISVLLGTFGQVNYVAANSSLDAHCNYAHHQGLDKVSVQWGAWVNLTGMMKQSALQLDSLTRFGIGSVPTKVGIHILSILNSVMIQDATIVANMFLWDKLSIPLLSQGVSTDSKRTLLCTDRTHPSTLSETQSLVSDHVRRVLGHTIDANMPFIDAGLDSMYLTELSRSIEICFDVPLPSTVAFDHPTITSLSKFIHKTTLRQKIDDCKPSAKEPMRIVVQDGIISSVACIAVHTGDADCKHIMHPVQFCGAIANGIDAIRKIPIDRWDVERIFSFTGISRKRDFVYHEYSRHGSFLRQLDVFDSNFFGIGRSDVRSLLEPQQRELLKACHEVTDVPYSDKSTRVYEQKISVYVGICTNDSDSVARDEAFRVMFTDSGCSAHDKLSNIAHGMSESTYAFASNRISHTFGFQGESISIDCASASGLVCIHLATSSSKVNVPSDPEYANSSIAASSNIILHRQLSDLHIARQMFPADGRCKTFDAQADGFERGEGVGAVMICTYKATSSKFMLVTLLGSSCIHKGGGASLRALRGPAIEYKVHRALLDANILPADVAFVEASGLGEPLGDAIEIGAYQRIFCFEDPSRTSNIGFGSLHTNLGHLDGASGMISLIKSALMSHALLTSPLVHFRKLNNLLLGQHACTTAEKMGHTWRDVNLDKRSHFPMLKGPTSGGIIGTSSFGYGGSMAHVLTNVRRDCRAFQEPRHRQNVLLTRCNAANQNTHVDANRLTFQLQKCIWNELHSSLSRNEPCRRRHPLSMSEPLHNVLRDIGFSHCGSGEFRENTIKGIAASVDAAIKVVTRETFSVGLSAGERICLWIESQVKKYTPLTDSNSWMPRLRLHEPKVKGKILFVLSSPRSGSTLLQMILNSHPSIFAPQELYLLNFETMYQRFESISRGHSWAFEGLRKAIVELRGCFADEADKIMHDMHSMSTKNVYEVLQNWCGDRILVDKSPPYSWSLDTLERAESIFEDVYYIFIHRHPYATIHSMSKETFKSRHDILENEKLLQLNGRKRLELLSASTIEQIWSHMDKLWARGNSNIIDFLRNVESTRQLEICYEDLVSDPTSHIDKICDFLKLPSCTNMTNPYSYNNAKMFEPIEPGGKGAADPNILSHCFINPTLANAWKDAASPGNLSEQSQRIAATLRYRLPQWKHRNSPVSRSFITRLNGNTTTPIVVFLNDVDCGTSFYSSLASSIKSAAFVVTTDWQSSTAASVSELAAMYVQRIRAYLDINNGDEVILVTRGLGVYIAREFVRLCETKQHVCADPSWREQASDAIQSNPKILGLVTLFTKEYEVLVSQQNNSDVGKILSYAALLASSYPEVKNESASVNASLRRVFIESNPNSVNECPNETLSILCCTQLLYSSRDPLFRVNPDFMSDIPICVISELEGISNELSLCFGIEHKYLDLRIEEKIDESALSDAINLLSKMTPK